MPENDKAVTLKGGYKTKYGEFQNKLRRLINEESMENHSNTDDHTLAVYLTDCLNAYERAVNSRDFMNHKTNVV